MVDIIKKLQENTKDPEGDFPSMFVMDGSFEKKYMYPFLYRQKNKDGTFQKKQSELNIAISYNPFTGEKL